MHKKTNFLITLFLLLSITFSLKSKECLNTDNLNIGIIENDYIDYSHYLYYMLGEYTHSKSIKFEFKNVENDIDQFDIIFGEYYDLNNLSVNKIDLPDKIINFYTDNGLDISENLLPLDLDTLILLSKSNHEEFYFENLINLYDPIKYTLGFSIKPRENLYKIFSHILYDDDFNLNEISAESKLDLLSKSYKNLNRNLINSNFLEIYNSYENNENIFTIFSDGILLYRNIDYNKFQLLPKSKYYWDNQKGFFVSKSKTEPVSFFGFSAFLNNSNQTDFICFLIEKHNRMSSFKNFNVEISPLSISELTDLEDHLDEEHKLILQSKNEFIKYINNLDNGEVYSDLSDILLNKKKYEDIVDEFKINNIFND